jgi:hypothetical protein
MLIFIANNDFGTATSHYGELDVAGLLEEVQSVPPSRLARQQIEDPSVDGKVKPRGGSVVAPHVLAWRQHQRHFTA